MQKNNVQWVDYLYSNSKGKLFNVISNYGYPLPENLRETHECMSYIIEQEGDKVEKEILKCFPEYVGIEKIIEEEKKVKGSYLNFSDNDRISQLEKQIEFSKIENELNNLKRFQNILIFSTMILAFHFLSKK
jgi:hypothetical protein